MKNTFSLNNNRVVFHFFVLTVFLAFAIFLIVYLPSEYQKTKPFKSDLENENGNLHIYVENTSFHPEIDIDIFLNEEKIISKKYPFDPKHPYKKLTFNVEPGTYNFKFLSSGYNIEKSEIIDIGKTPWILVQPMKNQNSVSEFHVFKKATRFLFL